MKELDKLVENFFQPKQESVTLGSLLEMVEEQMCEMSKITLEVKDSEIVSLKEEEGQNILTVAALPDIPVSELGWSSLATDDEGKEVPSEQRQQLMNFLQNIQGQDLQEKLKSLSDFYDLDESTLNNISSGPSSSAISKALSYLTFYKTLTTIITNFNSASAGFSFESFLAVLLGGQQIPTGNETIADFTTSDGTPVSLKLYKEGQLEVGGSYTDLVNDLVDKGTMQYVCVTKALEGSEMSVKGTLTFYRFNFNLENVFNILARSSKQSRKCILLPRPFMRSNGEAVSDEVSKKAPFPSAEELEPEFWSAAEKLISRGAGKIQRELGDVDLNQVKQALDWAKNPSLHGKNGIPGKKKISTAAVAKVLSGLLGAGSTALKDSSLVGYIVKANDAVVAKYSQAARDEKRKTTINSLYFYGKKSDDQLVEASMKFYLDADDELKKKCLRVSLGYVDTRHFNLTQNMVMKITQIAQPTPGQIFPEGQSEVGIGAIEIGYEKINEMLRGITSVINEAVFSIFNNLKALTTNIQGYFAGGLDDDKQADTAITAANNIETKTKEVKSKTT